MAEPPRFETGRLTLRPFGADDIEPLADIFAHTEAMWDVLSIPGLPEDPRAVAMRRMADAAEGWRDHGAGFWAVAARGAGLAPDGRLIGYCGFVNPARGEADTAAEAGAVLEVGWAIHPALQRRGLAGEAMAAVLDHAFGAMGCAALIGITDPENRGSRGLMERLGFAFDGNIHAYGVPQVRYSLARDDYLAARAGG